MVRTDYVSKPLAYNEKPGATNMPVFICRWQNGDFSVVSAPSRETAITMLDEVGNAENCDLFPVKNFMAHFRLKEQADGIDEMVPVELEEFGEDTCDLLCERVYPVYNKAVMDAIENWPDNDPVPLEKVNEVLRNFNEALQSERTRQWGAKPPGASARPAAALGIGGDIPKAGAERVVKERRRRHILEMTPISDKVQ